MPVKTVLPCLFPWVIPHGWSLWVQQTTITNCNLQLTPFAWSRLIHSYLDILCLSILSVQSESPRQASASPPRQSACLWWEKDERMEMEKWKDGEGEWEWEKGGVKGERWSESLRTGEGKCIVTPEGRLGEYGLLNGLKVLGSGVFFLFLKKVWHYLLKYCFSQFVCIFFE